MPTKQTFTAGQVLTAAQLNTLQDYVGVVQVKSTTKTDTFTMSSTTFADVTGLSVSITPTSASNKVLVRAIVNGAGSTSSSSNTFVRLLRGSTVIGQGDAAGTRQQGNAVLGIATYLGFQQSGVVEFLDSPATTSSTTYKIQIASQTASQTSYVNRSENDGDDPSRLRTSSTITVSEVTP